MTEKNEKIETKKPDFGSAVLALLVGNLIQQGVLETVIDSMNETSLSEDKRNELQTQLKDARELINRGLKHVLPELPDDK